MTSPVAEGMAPCPPGPVSVMRSELASDMAMPARRATKPEGTCEVTWNPTRRASSMTVSAPRSSIALAPQSASSAGWKRKT